MHDDIRQTKSTGAITRRYANKFAGEAESLDAGNYIAVRNVVRKYCTIIARLRNRVSVIAVRALFLIPRACSDVVSDVSPRVHGEIVSPRRRNFRREAVVVEFGHQMSLRHGGRPRGAGDLKPQQRGLIGARSTDKSADTPSLCGRHALSRFLPLFCLPLLPPPYVSISSRAFIYFVIAHAALSAYISLQDAQSRIN